MTIKKIQKPRIMQYGDSETHQKLALLLEALRAIKTACIAYEGCSTIQLSHFHRLVKVIVGDVITNLSKRGK